LAEYALGEVGADPDDVHEVQLALTEACANVLEHAGPGDNYDVDLTIFPDGCTIDVVDLGVGFDAPDAPRMSGDWAENGRGLALIEALMDDVRLTSQPDRGTVVHLAKNLRFRDNAPARWLARAEARRVQESG
jgi:serine/threonine-protein kinase RsbW